MQQTCIHGDASLFSFWLIINDFNDGITLYLFLHIWNKTCFTSATEYDWNEKQKKHEAGLILPEIKLCDV